MTVVRINMEQIAIRACYAWRQVRKVFTDLQVLVGIRTSNFAKTSAITTLQQQQQQQQQQQ